MMDGLLAPRAQARQPQQERSRRRFERILDEAERLLLESGLAGFSIPALAERLRFNRATIYQYFPTPYALLNELTRRQLNTLEDVLQEKAAEVIRSADGEPNWRETVRLIVCIATDFHNSHPIGRMLILGGPATGESHSAQTLTIQHLGQLARQLLERHGFRVPDTPDVATLAVDLGTTCFRVSFHKHGKITEPYRDEAARVMTRYLELYEPEVG